MSRLASSSAYWRAGLGAVAWACVTYWTVRDLRGFHWSSSLLLFAALVLMPLVLELVGSEEPSESGAQKRGIGIARMIQFPSAILLLVASGRPPGVGALLFALPWIIFMGLLAWVGAGRIWRRGVRPMGRLCLDGGLLFAGVGGGWVAAERFGFQPLGFGTDIVQLTAVHFHYAGVVLPVVTGLVLREFSSSRIAWLAGGGVLTGVPLVAVGITVAQLGGGHLVELLAGLVLAGSAGSVAVLQLRLAGDKWRPFAARVLWVVGSVSLSFGMTLALLYAARTFFAPLPWLDIPWMRALHGTSNALGFAFCSAAGWAWHLLRQSRKTA